MRRLLLLSTLLLLTPLLLKAQGGTTLITARVLDPFGIPYINSQVNITFYDPGTSHKLPLLNGSTFQTQYVVQTDSNGYLLPPVALPDNGIIASSSGATGTQWTFRVVYQDRLTSFTGTFTINCSTNTPATCTSNTIDLTSSLQAIPSAPIPNPGSAIAFAGVPSGPCTTSQTAVNTLTGDFYSCVGGVWLKVGPGGNPGTLTSPVTTPNPLNLDVNVGFKGPNPYIDATRFGVRAVSSDGFSTTVSCTNGSPNVTIASASSFQNGDGVALYGCGPGTIVAPAAPTVTPSLAAGQTGLLIDVPGPAGGTTYCYQLLARTLMGATNVSPETCTATGPATLGLQTNTITSASLANNTATYITSAPHGLVVGAQIVITGMATNVFTGETNGTSVNIPFNGWFKVATVADNTHFTVKLLTDSRNGAITAGTGGMVSYWNSMHIVATETANNYQYYVYGRVTGGTKTLIGTMWPQDLNLVGRLTDVTYLVFDDFGSTVTTFPNPPLYIPTTVPTTPTHDMLSTTIVSGAGTTSLVLADNAGNTISGQTIIFDDAVTFLKAATYAANLSAGTNGPLMLPEPGNNAASLGYPFNSPITLGVGATSRLAVMQKGLVRINEPIAMSFVNWVGQTDSNNTIASFANTISPAIQVKRASPGIFGLHANFIYNVATSLLSSGGSTMMIQESGGIPSSGAWRDVTFVTGPGGTTYSNMPLVLRGDGAGYDFTDTTLSGSQNGNLTATTPGMYFDGIGNAVYKNLSLGGIGIAIRPPPAGSFILADGVYCQGCYEPYFSWAADATDVTSGVVMSLRNVTTDTTSLPVVANYGGHAVTVDIVNENTVSSNNPNITGSGTPTSTPRMNIRLSGTGGIGTPVNFGSDVRNNAYLANDGIFGRVTFPIDTINHSMSIGPAFSLFTTTGFYPAPTCPVSAGGSVPVGTIYYAYAPIFANGSEGTMSFACSATTTGGNQTVTLNWAAIPGVTQYNLYRGLNSLGNVGGLNCAPFTFASLPYVDIVASTCGYGGTLLAAGGPAGIQGGLVWGNTIQIGNTLFANLGTPPNGTLLFCSDCTIANPCAGGGTGALAKRLNGVWVCN